MRPYERRKSGGYPYYKLAFWNPHTFCWQDGKKSFPTPQQAKAPIVQKGKYRISQIDQCGRTDLEPFSV